MNNASCPLCGIELQHEFIDEELESGETVTKIQEEQMQIWVHNPRNLHEDILVSVHKDCYDKVKVVYPTFDKPTEKDWASPRLPFISGSKITLRALSASTERP